MLLSFKKKIGKIKLNIIPCKASPAPPIGSNLGQKGLNILDFCKKFNEFSLKFKSFNLSFRVLINYYSDKSYDFILKKPSLSVYLKKFLNYENFFSKKNIFFLKILEILKFKNDDFNTSNFYSNLKTLISSLKSMNIFFINDDY